MNDDEAKAEFKPLELTSDILRLLKNPTEEVQWEESEETEEGVEIVYQEVRDELSENIGLAIFEGPTVKLFPYNHWSIGEISDDVVIELMASGCKSIGLREIAEVKVDLSQQATCKYFTANEYVFERDGLARAKNYPYANLSRDNTCCHPEFTGGHTSTPTPCESDEDHTRCDGYGAQGWDDLEAFLGRKDGKEDRLVMSSTRLGMGRNIYRIMDGDGDVSEIENANGLKEFVNSSYDSYEELPIEQKQEEKKESLLHKILSR